MKQEKEALAPQHQARIRKFDTESASAAEQRQLDAKKEILADMESYYARRMEETKTLEAEIKVQYNSVSNVLYVHIYDLVWLMGL